MTLKPHNSDPALMSKKNPFRGKENGGRRGGGTTKKRLNPSQGMSPNMNDSPLKCFYCGKFFHIAKLCRKKKFDEGQQRYERHTGHFEDDDHNQDLRMFMDDSDEKDEADTWYVDSGVSTHMTGNIKWIEK